jgi:polar amino acid transport system substrate-binding protein
MFSLCSANKLFAWVLLLGALSTNVVNAEPYSPQSIERMRVNVGLTVFPPYVQQDTLGHCFGNIVDEVINMFPSEKYELSLYCSTPARVYRDLSNSAIDLTVNVKSTKRMAEHVYFSNAPAVNLEVLLLSYPQRSVKSVAAIREFSYGDTRERLESQGVKIVEQSNSKEAVTVFLRGGTDAIVTYRSPFSYYYDEILQNTSLLDQNIEFDEVSLGKVGAYFVVNQKSKSAEQLLEIINTANQCVDFDC